jgi:hypothetical protein
VIALRDPWGAEDGGTLRARLIAEAVALAGLDTTCVFPSGCVRIDRRGQTVEETRNDTRREQAGKGRLHRLKRRYVPRPTVAGARHGFLARSVERLGPTDLLVLPQVNFRDYRRMARARCVWQDLPDVWTEVLTRETRDWRGLPRLTAAAQKAVLARYEASLARDCSLVTAAGWAEGQRLASRIGCDVHWLPTAIAGSAPLPAREGQPVRAGFLANFEYRPNRDALDHLLHAWLPRIRQLGWHLVVAGRGSERLRLPEDTECLGTLDGVRSFYEQIDLTLAPIRLGGGVKVKVIESLAYNRPVVGTTFALEGFSPAVQAMAVADDGEPPLLTNWREPTIDRDVVDALFLERSFKERVAALLQTGLA